jgi:DNA-binding FadR family transcriptional regulator
MLHRLLFVTPTLAGALGLGSYARGIGPQALVEHRRIADAVLAADPAAAADAMRIHLDASHARLRPAE